jgi:hypothetical protein
MNQVSMDDVNYLQSLINSLQYEVSKAKDNGGFVCFGYLTEKVDKIKKLIEIESKKN